jgi:hypothetical protein
LGDLRRHTPDHGERRIQMKISGVDETEGRHKKKRLAVSF